MRRRICWLILALVVVSSGIGGAFFWRYYTSPRYTLHQMVLALKDKNYDKFFNYLDIQEILKNLGVSVTKELAPPEEPEEDDWTRLGRRLGKRFANQVLPRLLENFEGQIKKGVQHFLATLDNAKILAIGAAVSMADIQVRGEEALVTIKGPTKGETFRLTMRRPPGEKTWKVVDVNYDDLKRIIKYELL